MELHCSPSNLTCQLHEFPLWLVSEHWGVLLAVLIATACAWLIADRA